MCKEEKVTPRGNCKWSREVEALCEAGGRGKAEEIRKTNDYCILAVESGLDPE